MSRTDDDDNELGGVAPRGSLLLLLGELKADMQASRNQRADLYTKMEAVGGILRETTTTLLATNRDLDRTVRDVTKLSGELQSLATSVGKLQDALSKIAPDVQTNVTMRERIVGMLWLGSAIAAALGAIGWAIDRFGVLLLGRH